MIPKFLLTNKPNIWHYRSEFNKRVPSLLYRSNLLEVGLLNPKKSLSPKHGMPHPPNSPELEQNR